MNTIFINGRNFEVPNTYLLLFILYYNIIDYILSSMIGFLIVKIKDVDLLPDAIF